MKSLPAADCIALIGRLEAAGIPWAVTAVNEPVCVTSDAKYIPLAPPVYFPTYFDPAFDYRALDTLYKVNIACTEEQQAHIDLGGLPAVRFDRGLLLIEPTEKQKGIRRMLERMQVPDEDVVIFGDGTNDMCMFGQGWFSVDGQRLRRAQDQGGLHHRSGRSGRAVERLQALRMDIKEKTNAV